MILLSDEHAPGGGLRLGMAFQAEVRVALNQQLGINRAVGRMANSATLAQRLVFENERARLLTVTYTFEKNAKTALLFPIGWTTRKRL